ncbi:hypothetical protein MKW98_012661 [Papaver atlanticum]|uniref:Uncharacterized protein n=1 Tax=Papaver atlanticum TaxID=357466 RepID=A0AAD4T079_9MAGN|nr:hypothetical protein MKW98_012661 [Papaver atlanticum]
MFAANDLKNEKQTGNCGWSRSVELVVSADGDDEDCCRRKLEFVMGSRSACLSWENVTTQLFIRVYHLALAIA